MMHRIAGGILLSLLVLFAAPAYVMSHQPGFQLRHVWQVGVAAVAIQFVVNMALLQREFKRKLNFDERPSEAPVATPLAIES